MTLVKQLAKMSLSAGGAILTGVVVPYIPLLTVYGSSTSHEALLVLNNNQVVPLKDIAPPVKLSNAARMQKVEMLKNKIYGFSKIDTARLKDSLDKLLSIQDASVLEVLDNVPDNLAIEYKKDENGYVAGQFSFADSKIFITDVGLNSPDVFLTGNLAHEMFHAKQSARGFVYVPPMYRNTETTAVFNLIVEAEARSFERHVRMRLSEPENFKVNVDELYKMAPKDEQVIYEVAYYKALDSVQRHYPHMSQKALEQEAELIARGNYIHHLLTGGNYSWGISYLKDTKQKITTANDGLFCSLPKKSDERLEKYMWAHMEKTYGLTRNDIQRALNMIFQTPAGQEVLAFKTSESNWMNRIKNAKELYYMERKKQVPALCETYNANTVTQPVQRVTSLKAHIWQNKTR